MGLKLLKNIGKSIKEFLTEEAKLIIFCYILFFIG